MKIEFKCYNCNAENEFETTETIIEISKKRTTKSYDIYVVKCQSCGAENRIKVPK